MSLADWTKRPRPGQWPLTGPRIVLEPLDWDAHGQALYQVVAAPDIADMWDYMPMGPFEDYDDFKTILTKICDFLEWETMVFRKVGTGTVLGMSSFMRIRKSHGSAEVGCVAFGRALRRTPEATEAMFLMAQHLFDELGYRRYEWKCHNENAASRRAAARFGFQFEGIFRNDMVVDGKNRDTAWFAMTDDDWPSVKAAYESWLMPSNFDAAGQQKRTLESFRS